MKILCCLLLFLAVTIQGVFDFGPFEQAIKNEQHETFDNNAIKVEPIKDDKFEMKTDFEDTTVESGIGGSCDAFFNQSVIAPYFLSVNGEVKKIKDLTVEKTDSILDNLSYLEKLVNESSTGLTIGLVKVFKKVEESVPVCNCECNIPKNDKQENDRNMEKEDKIIRLLAEGINVISNNGSNIYDLIKILDKKFNIFLNGTLSPNCVLTNWDHDKEKKDFDSWQKAEFSAALNEFIDYVKSYTINYGTEFEIWLRRSPMSAFIISSVLSFVFGLLIGTCICLMYAYCQNCIPLVKEQKEQKEQKEKNSNLFLDVPLEKLEFKRY